MTTTNNNQNNQTWTELIAEEVALKERASEFVKGNAQLAPYQLWLLSHSYENTYHYNAIMDAKSGYRFNELLEMAQDYCPKEWVIS